MGCPTLAFATSALVSPVEANEFDSQDLRPEQVTSSQAHESADIHFISDLTRSVSASELIAQATNVAAEPDAPAVDRRGFYLSASGMWQGRQRASEVDVANTFLDFDSGFALSAAAGYRFSDIRLEAEFTYFNNPINQASATIPFELGFSTSIGSGECRSLCFYG
ncbi:hypothetical protein HC928_23740 [bacterium]|nr:hypothetical protein [bacterium]